MKITRQQPGHSRAATIKSVAEEAGVSTATVSRVLTGANVVGKKVREQVLKAARKLNYNPNRLARSLRAGRRKVIGVIIPDLQNPFLTGVVHGIESVLYQAGYTLLLGHSDGFAERELAHMSVLRGEGAAGLIIIPDNGSGANYSQFATWDIPVVAIDRIPRGVKVDLISTDHHEGAREAVAHLLGHGYKDVALINGPAEFSVARERLAGYQEALRQGGVTFRGALVINSDFRQDGGRSAMLELLDLPAPPRAVLVGNNLMALGALQAVHERGVRVPEDMAIIGFDDMPWAASLRPPLSAVAQPIEELGQIAARVLLERLDNPQHVVRQVILPPRLVLRASCGTHR